MTSEPTPEVPEDEMGNNLLATGALFAVLSGIAGADAVATNVTVVTHDGLATNQLAVQFAFLKSRYRITVERIHDDDEEGQGRAAPMIPEIDA